MIGAGSWIDLAGLPRATFDALYADGPDAIIAGAINPSGSIEAVDGGYRVTGRWAFASGCQHASWIFGDCFEGVVDGVPQLRIAVFSPDQVVIEDTWHVSGLAGTGSHHFHVDGVVVPADWTYNVLAARAVHRRDHRAHPDAGADRVRRGERGHRDRAGRARRHRRARRAQGAAPRPRPARRQPDVPARPGDGRHRAARGASARARRRGVVVGDGCSTATSRRSTSGRAVRAAAAWATARAAAVVDTAYRAGGGSSLYLDSPLQRRLRDIHAITQHFIVRRDTMTTAGAILAGNEPDLLLF